MKIETTYNIGDKVTIEDYVTTYEQCPICEGKGRVKIKGKKFYCPECNGKGKLEKSEKQPKTIDITNIEITVDYQNNIIARYLSKQPFDDWNLYPPSFTEIIKG